MYHFDISAHTDIGDRTGVNQDSILARAALIAGQPAGLFLVADGCGGLGYGEAISGLLAARFARLWDQELPPLLETRNPDESVIEQLLEDTIREVNGSARSFGAQVESRVGSTLSLLLLYADRYLIKNIGDSRVYRLRGRKMKKLTEDQSLVADLLRSGVLTEEEARSYPKQNVLTMCVGGFDQIQMYTTKGRLRRGDCFLLCCDGLYRHLPESEMYRILRQRRGAFSESAAALRDAITPGRASDNVSAVLCRSTGPFPLRSWLLLLLGLLLTLNLLHEGYHAMLRALADRQESASCACCGEQFRSPHDDCDGGLAVHGAEWAAGEELA